MNKDDGVFIFSAVDKQREFAYKVSGGSNITDVIEAFKAFLLAVGYHPDTVKEALGEE